jgi:hypothetical protein
MPITEGGRFSPNPNIISPGVFTRENDLSSVAQGVADIGAVVVAPFPKGPGFSPTLVQSISELESKFGVADGIFYGNYTAQQYLQEKGFVTVCRVGALTGYHQKYPWIIWAESGVWNRNPDAGWLEYEESIISQTGLTFSTVNSSQSASVANFTGSITFANQPVTLQLQEGIGTAVNTANKENNSGSLLYYGSSVQGYLSGVFSYTGSISNVTTASVSSARNRIVGGKSSDRIFGKCHIHDRHRSIRYCNSITGLHQSVSRGL